MQNNIPSCFYRISIKALILDENKKFLLCKEPDGRWELPGGGLDFGENPKSCIQREITEETGLKVTYVANNPSYFLTAQWDNGLWFANVIYITKVYDYIFSPSDECIDVRFFNKNEALNENLFSNVNKFIELYNPKKH